MPQYERAKAHLRHPSRSSGAAIAPPAVHSPSRVGFGRNPPIPRSWYGRHVAPYVVHAGCSADAFTRMRQRMMPLAQGVVVEVGFGSGLNLPYYDPAKVTRLIGVDPDETMLALAKRQSDAMPFAMECLQAGAESMPLADGLQTRPWSPMRYAPSPSRRRRWPKSTAS